MNGTAAHGNTPPQPPSASVLTLRPTTPDPDKSDLNFSFPCASTPEARPRAPTRGDPCTPTPAGPAAAADVNTQILSGLTWRSGATGGGFPCLAQMRGRQLDANTIFIAPPSFAEMVQNTGSWVRLAAGKAPLLVVSLALLPGQNKGQFAQCAAGQFDGSFRQVGANLKATGAKGVVVWLG